MVSPLEKQAHNAVLFKTFDPSLDGAIAWMSEGDFLEPNSFELGETQFNLYLSRRAAGGWESRSNQAPATVLEEEGGADFTPDLASLSRCGNVGPADAGLACALRDPSGVWLPRTPAYPSLNGLHPKATYQGASADLSTVVFEVNPFTFLVPEDTYGMIEEPGGSLYEITGVGGPSPQLSLVNVTTSGESFGSGHHLSVGYLEENQNEWDAYQAISASGHTIFFTATPAGGVPTLYARVNAAETVPISNPVPTECTTCGPTVTEAKFQGASADGSKAFFITEQQLLNSDIDATPDLYEYDFNRPSASRIVQLSAGGAGDLTPGAGADVQGVVRTSPDGSHVYFVATGVLTTIPNGNGQLAIAGADNMYVVDTSNGETEFVADLCSGSEQSGTSTDPACPASPTTVDSPLWSLDKGQSQVTPDGRYLVFSTVAALTPDDLNSALDVYRYDSQSGELIRASIGEPSYPPSQDNNTGADAELGEPPTRLAFGGAFADVNDSTRAITDDGSSVIFVTSASLQADDVNAESQPSSCNKLEGSPGCDVYVWHDGVVSMISSGRESSAPAGESTGVYGAVISPSGSDIYFATRAQFVGQDTDRLADVYDARTNGGFPAPKPEPSCTVEEWTCQGTGSEASGPSEPQGSATQQAGGNLSSAPFTEMPEPASKSKPLTRARKLAKALKDCRKNKNRKKRAACERHARKKYGPLKKANTTNRRGY